MNVHSPPTKADAPLDPLRVQRQALRFEVGGRTLWRVHRDLVSIGCPLEELIDGADTVLPELDPTADGYSLHSIRAGATHRNIAARSDMIRSKRQHYPRHFIRLDTDFDGYLAGFSAKSRSTLRRKRKRWIRAAGRLDVRAYSSVAEITEFYKIAQALSALTYQARLLNAGLPKGKDALAGIQRLARDNNVRAYILFNDDRPASYLYLPVEDTTLIYAYLGYDPALIALSAGTVLQMEVLERLFAERKFRYFDFTEGDGPHKRLFGTDMIECMDMLLLRPTLSNHLLVKALGRFDSVVLTAGAFADRGGLKPVVRRLLRR